MEKALQDFLARLDKGLEIKEEVRGDDVIFHCRGAFSLGSYNNLDGMGRKIRETNAARVILDMRDVLQMDSTGLGTLAMIFKDARSAGKQLVVIPSEEVRSHLEPIHLDKVFPLASDLNEALRFPRK